MENIKENNDYPWLLKNTDRLGYTTASQDGTYASKKWRALREYKLSNNPICEVCEKNGRITPAILVDHITPVTSGEDDKFYEYSNLQSLCDYHHRVKTRRDNSKYSDSNIQRGKDIMDDLEK